MTTMPADAPVTPSPRKAALRAAALDRRDALEIDDRLEWDSEIAARVLALPVWESPGPVSAYWPMRSEADPRPILEALNERGLPLCLPAIAVTAIFTFINAWNEFVVALTMLRSQESYTLPIQVFSLVAGRYTIEWHHVMAATLLATLPVAILFIWLQRYLVRGLALGAVK